MMGTTAVVYSEAFFGTPDGKTANGLVRHSGEVRDPLGDRQHQGGSSIPARISTTSPTGSRSAPTSRTPSPSRAASPTSSSSAWRPSAACSLPLQRGVVLDAMRRGMHIVNGLHEFLNDDLEFTAAAAKYGVLIHDVRRPRAKKDLRMFTGDIDRVTCPRIAVLGTDGAIGKRTTAVILTRALNERGIKAVMVGTGQTGLIQGARYGVALDAIPCQFCSGEVEATVVEAFEAEHPDVIIIEGQGALSHPAYLSSTFILRGARPDAVDPAARARTPDAGRLPGRADADAGE